jgi:hypothetical protein
MNNKSIVLSISLVLSIGLAVAGAALAQGMMGGSGQGMMGRGMMHGDTMGHSMMQGGSPGMMGHGMQGGMMCPMMGGMMQGSVTGSGMMGHGMMGGAGGMGALFGSRVVPTMNLSVDDVRGYLTAQLDRLGNKRLKVGNINADGGFVTADIATVDNSLVQRVKVNRSTGAIEYEN